MDHRLFLTDLVPVSDYVWCTISDGLISNKNVVANSEDALFFLCNSWMDTFKQSLSCSAFLTTKLSVFT